MKLTLIVQSGTLAGSRFDLTEGFFTVGRGAGCNLLFDPMQENMVSSKHAHFEVKPDGFYLLDDRSTNGTFVNGNHIQVVKLNDGDTVQFGKNGPLATVTIEIGMVQPPAFSSAHSAPTEVIKPGDFGQPTLPPPNFVQPLQSPQFEQPFQQPQFEQSYQPQPNFRNSMNYIGLNPPSVKVEEGSKVGKIIGAVVAVAIYAVLAVFATLLIVSSVGLVPAIIASVAAFIPPLIYIIPLIFLDRYDPEPPWLIAAAFAWGGIVAVVFSFIINTAIGEIVLAITRDPDSARIAGAVISAPIFEELSKGLGVVILLIFFRREFDDILDGIVYGGVIGLGFATVENVLYYGRGVGFELYGRTPLNDNVPNVFFYLMLIRGIASPFIHSTFTAMTGIGCGISRESHNTFIKIIMPVVGYLGAVFLHAMWNGMATFAPRFYVYYFNGKPEDAENGFWIFYAVLAVPFFFIFVGFCAYIMRRQNKILRESLAIDVAQGVLSNEQFKTATSAFKSTGWLLGGVTSGKFFARWRFLRAVGKLGLTYWHIQRANAAQGHTGSFKTNPILRQQVIDLRDKV